MTQQTVTTESTTTNVTELDRNVANTTVNATAEDVHNARMMTKYHIQLKFNHNVVSWYYNTCDHAIHELTQAGLAQRVADIARGHIFYDLDRGVWMIFQGQYWAKLNQKSEAQLYQIASQMTEMLRTEMAQNLVSKLGVQLNPKTKDAERFIRSSATKAGLSAMFSLAKSSDLLGRNNVEYNRDPYRLNLANGQYQIAEMKGTEKVKGARKLEDYKQDDYCTTIIPVKYDKTADAPLFKKFLKTFTGWDADLENYLQLLAGDALLGTNEFQHFTFLQGPASTGKSTILRIWSSVLGDGQVDEQISSAISGIPFRLFTSGKVTDANANTPVLARLAGKRMVITTEPDDSDKLNEGFVKSSTAGDRITAQAKYEQPFSFKPGFSMFIATNYLPKSSASDAMMRRMIIVRADHVVTSSSLSYDSNLSEKIINNEKEGVLNWMIRGAERLTDINLEQIKKSKELQKQVREGKASEDTRIEKDPLVLEMPDTVKKMQIKYKTEANSASEFLYDSLLSKEQYWNYISTSNELDRSKFFKADRQSHGNVIAGKFNHTGRFSRDAKVVADASTYTTASDLYDVYFNSYCKRQGIKFPIKRRSFDQTVAQYLPSARTHAGKSWLGIGLGPTQYNEGSYGQSIDNIRWKIDASNRKSSSNIEQLLTMLKANKHVTKSQAKKIHDFVNDNSNAYLNRLYSQEETLVNPANGQEVDMKPDFKAMFDKN